MLDFQAVILRALICHIIYTGARNKQSGKSFHASHSLGIYTPQKMFLLAFSFANFETTRGNTGKANIYTAQKRFLLNFQNSQMKKRGETLFGECIRGLHTKD